MIHINERWNNLIARNLYKTTAISSFFSISLAILLVVILAIAFSDKNMWSYLDFNNNTLPASMNRILIFLISFALMTFITLSILLVSVTSKLKLLSKKGWQMLFVINPIISGIVSVMLVIGQLFYFHSISTLWRFDSIGIILTVIFIFIISFSAYLQLEAKPIFKN